MVDMGPRSGRLAFAPHLVRLWLQRDVAGQHDRCEDRGVEAPP